VDVDDSPEVSPKIAAAQNSSPLGEDSVTPSPRAKDDEPMLYCPVCSKRLSERKCKLFCEQCGYYMSCADYY
jgi:hypothetical protein